MEPQNFSALDRCVIAIDDGLRTVFGRPQGSGAAAPDALLGEAHLTPAERRISEGLMRVNHTGEICAQALYSAQALTARDEEVRARMAQAAAEENDHLLWCERRLRELNGRLSVLNPIWYAGSFLIGALAGFAGDRWNLGFVVETERQVVRHLDGHLDRLPAVDARSRAIVARMREDEAQHATAALRVGAVELPEPVKRLMAVHSRIMTGIAYWI